MLKLLTIVGARPQFIKASTVSRVVAQSPCIKEIILHTGQHYDRAMSDVFFAELAIPQPQYNLGIGSGSHGQQTGQMLAAVEQVLLQEQPDIVLVYGDTNSTLAGALAAAKLHIPIAHVEAGLRSFNRSMPEEINRVLTDHAADLLFAPTQVAVDHLLAEGITPAAIYRCGDVMYDASLYFAARAEGESTILEHLALGPKQYCLATIHRAENTDDPQRLANIFSSLTRLGQDITVVLPLHPRTRKALGKMQLLDQVQASLRIIDPVGYLDMIALERQARLILTDSGGVQKEAFFFRVPCVVLRDETEWTELIDLGCNRLVPPTTRDEMLAGILDHLRGDYFPPTLPLLYGDGRAAHHIVAILHQLQL
ncbi:non-hydrolyzing UDP-N-acetylglucosamine 2-epimerase [Phormidium tenue]|uniref:UDP-N-acetylglucosamine 2-epimerase n=1 Tax=Phormidium tenue NIES-30 TaxID=549789 RepID=A0A1U7J824_9CYAN|nr:UDP-N-acetylglucosamine 2-epimerase (non-hydrolyzing) [Phormidium tenue]MBD2231231.1 UDP-N-acetylglucosamine 2-epimerase (non-hydrolyzing) [Phormidium tenue FACHB-1052]OKH49479.1 UDP-N-acetylglucosamine 2-epimerase [Phormidium tenue NIES-30]